MCLTAFSSDSWKLPVYPLYVKLIRYRIIYTKDRSLAWQLLWFFFQHAEFLSRFSDTDFLVWREIIAWPQILNTIQHQIWQMGWVLLVFFHKHTLPLYPKSWLNQIFLLFLGFKILLSRLWHKKILQIHSNLIFNLYHQKQVRKRGFLPLPQSYALLTNSAFGREGISHWSSKGELRIPYKKSAFKPRVCYSSLSSRENSKILGMFYGKLPF